MTLPDFLLAVAVVERLRLRGVHFEAVGFISHGVFRKWQQANHDGGVTVGRPHLRTSNEQTLSAIERFEPLVKTLLPPFPFHSERQLQQELDRAIDAGIMKARKEWNKTVFQIGIEARFALRSYNMQAGRAGQPLPYEMLVKTIDRIKSAQDKARPSLPLNAARPRTSARPLASGAQLALNPAAAARERADAAPHGAVAGRPARRGDAAAPRDRQGRLLHARRHPRAPRRHLARRPAPARLDPRAPQRHLAAPGMLQEP